MRARPLWLAVALGAAVAAAPVMAQNYSVLSTNMFGEKVGDQRGKKGATADFNGEADFVKARLCYYLEIYDLDGANALSLHKGKEGDDGDEVLALTLPKDRNDEACVKADVALLREIAAKPKEYYVLVGHPDHPDGAIRGQLSE